MPTDIHSVPVNRPVTIAAASPVWTAQHVVGTFVLPLTVDTVQLQVTAGINVGYWFIHDATAPPARSCSSS